MTVVVAIRCSDGVVIGCDSMITTGGDIAHHKGKKLWLLDGEQVFASAGTTAHGAHLRHVAECCDKVDPSTKSMDHVLGIAEKTIESFEKLHIPPDSIDVVATLAFAHGETHECAIFYGIQPEFLDEEHFFASIGSGQLSADPFLRFVADTFCEDGPPSVREAIFLVTWVIQYVIDTNPGGVAGPIRIATLEIADGDWNAKELEENEMLLGKEAVQSAREELRKWRDSFMAGDSDEESGMPAPPKPS